MMRASLAEALGVADRPYVYFVGSGGKTTVMYELAQELAVHHRVLTTTSTRMWPPRMARQLAAQRHDITDQAAFGSRWSVTAIVADEVSQLLMGLRLQRDGTGHVTVAKDVGRDGKLVGYDLPELDSLIKSLMTDYVLVEGDGASGCLLKGHDAHEPVVSAKADLVVAVIAADSVGITIDEQHVHHPRIVCERLGKEFGDVVTADDVARLVLHPQGYLCGAPDNVVVFVSRAGRNPKMARALVQALRGQDSEGRVGRVVIGELMGRAPVVDIM